MANLELSIASEESESESENETKNGKFRRLANQRAGIAVGAMRSLGRLVGPSYESSEEEVEKLIDFLTGEFNFMVGVLRHGNKPKKPGDLFS